MSRTPWKNLSPAEKSAVLEPFLAPWKALRQGAKTYQNCLDENRVRNRIRRLWDTGQPLDSPLTNRGVAIGARPRHTAMERLKYYWEK